MNLLGKRYPKHYKSTIRNWNHSYAPRINKICLLWKCVSEWCRLWSILVRDARPEHQACNQPADLGVVHCKPLSRPIFHSEIERHIFAMPNLAYVKGIMDSAGGFRCSDFLWHGRSEWWCL